MGGSPRRDRPWRDPAAKLLSHLYRGDVALNITLSAVNSLIAVLTLPLVTNLAIGFFDPPDAGSLGLQSDKVAQVFAVVLIPVAIGVLVRRRAPEFADRMDRRARITSAVVLALVIVGTMRWSSRWRSACWAAPSSPCRPPSTAC